MGPGFPRERCRVLSKLAESHIRRSDYQSALAPLREARDTARLLGDARVVAGIAARFADAFTELGQYRRGRHFARYAYRVLRDTDDHRTVGQAGVRALAGFDENRIKVGDLDYVRTRVRALRDHPALAGWLLVAEPELNDYDPRVVRAEYLAIRREDTHPVYVGPSRLDSKYPFRGASRARPGTSRARQPPISRSA